MKLPNITSENKENAGESGNMKNPSNWNAAMKFVNENIEKRLMNHDSDDVLPHYEDFESNDKNLSFLEDRLMAFHIRYGGKAKAEMKLPKLARFGVKVSAVYLLDIFDMTYFG